MNDEEALEALGAGDEADQAAARDHLAEGHVAWLMTFLSGRFNLDADLASRATWGAFRRLMSLASRDPGALPTSQRLRGWLASAAFRSAQDERRRDRGRQKASVVSLTGTDGEEVEEWVILPDNVAHRPEGAELARVVLAYLLQLDQPARGILLFDTLDQIQEMMEEELDLHDEELIDWGRDHGIWTRNALRSHRWRALRDLREHLRLRGFTP